MSDVTRILAEVQRGDRQASEDLLPLVYDELRQLAAAWLARERPGHTLQPTALVHEAWTRLVGAEGDDGWDGRGHFFAAAAESMRRILVEHARARGRQKRGGGWRRRPEAALNAIDGGDLADADEILDVDDALEGLAQVSPEAEQVVKLRYFAGFTNRQAAGLMGISSRKADQLWAYARAWLLEAIGDGD